MKNPVLVELIKEKFTEEKMSAEYELKLNKVADEESKFTKGFSKEKWKEYFHLDMEKYDLHSIMISDILDFAIEFIKSVKI